MPRRRPNLRPDLNGLLVIDKPLGMSSTAVVTKVRTRAGGARVGHAGALDPLATGVLIVCLGKATKAVPALMNADKRYRADVDLAAFSTTDDLEGDPIPIDAPAPGVEAVRAALTRFIGTVEQAPPVHSSIQVGGRRAYHLAREGTLRSTDATGHAALPTRPVLIHAVDLVSYEWPALVIDVHCGKGVYIRSLARDIGVALGTGGRLTGLRRTAVGAYTVEMARTLDSVKPPIEPEELLPAPPMPERATQDEPNQG